MEQWGLVPGVPHSHDFLTIASYEIIFDMTPEPLNSKAKQELSQSDEMESKAL